jgi:hypothetical protein
MEESKFCDVQVSPTGLYVAAAGFVPFSSSEFGIAVWSAESGEILDVIEVCLFSNSNCLLFRFREGHYFCHGHRFIMEI